MVDVYNPLTALEQMEALRRWREAYDREGNATPFDQVDWTGIKRMNDELAAANAQRLPSAEVLSYEQQRRALTQQLGQQQANLNFQRGNSDSNYQDQFKDLTKQFHDTREQMPYGHNARGTLNSGLWKRAVGDFATGQADSYAKFNKAQQQSNTGFDLQKRQYEDAYSQGQQFVNEREQARRQDLAASLRSIQ